MRRIKRDRFEGYEMSSDTESPIMNFKKVSMFQILKRLLGKDTSAYTKQEPLQINDWNALELLLREMASGKGGEARSRERAGRALEFYLRTEGDDRRRFLSILNDSFEVDEQKVRRSIDAYLNTADSRLKSRAAGLLLNNLESPRARILRQFNLLPNGVHELVSIRSELLRLGRDGEFIGLNQDLLRLFTSWFDIGFLELKRIGWSSPASLLEKLIRYEAVHEIKSWGDLRNRVDSDRRCYAFFHGRMPEEPLIFVEVALVQGIATSVQALLDENYPTLDPETADTAIFYSISNAQVGLRGVSMGEFLIKRVVEQLLYEFPKLQNFATLSPVPGFARWLDKRLESSGALPAKLENKLLGDGETCSEAIRRQLNAESESGRSVPLELKEWLLSECAYYLAQENMKGVPVDPVARFHFSNGASLGRINWLADSSKAGLRQSYGLMVNYMYKLRQIDSNHLAYAENGALSVADEIQKLVVAAQLRRRNEVGSKLKGKHSVEN